MNNIKVAITIAKNTHDGIGIGHYGYIASYLLSGKRFYSLQCNSLSWVFDQSPHK